jgi:hypothetical protein
LLATDSKSLVEFELVVFKAAESSGDEELEEFDTFNVKPAVMISKPYTKFATSKES